MLFLDLLINNTNIDQSLVLIALIFCACFYSTRHRENLCAVAKREEALSIYSDNRTF